MFEVITQRLAEINVTERELKKINENENKRTEINTPEDFFSEFVDLNPQKTKIMETKLHTDIYDLYDSVEDYNIENLINLVPMNDICSPEIFLEAVNGKLPNKGKFVCHAETVEQRFQRIMNTYPRPISWLIYILDFFWKRLFPKWNLTNTVYLFITKGKDKVFSLGHILGFFACYGFKIKYLKDINKKTYFIFEKERIPFKNGKSSSGIIFKTDRVGKNGKLINLYKIRTMHPYSEYIQQFVYDLNGSNNGDKLNDDFRVASWGRFFRRYWVDEIPMLINLIKGEIKLVGVRPLSLCKFNMYPQDLQQLRITTKPGLIPPFYADMPETFEELLESERNYLLAYKDCPLKTDVKYFFKCVYNILFKHAHSA